MVLVQGPAGVGKSTLIRGLVRHYTKHSLSEVKGPITVVSGKSRRLTFVECPQVRKPLAILMCMYSCKLSQLPMKQQRKPGPVEPSSGCLGMHQHDHFPACFLVCRT